MKENNKTISHWDEVYQKTDFKKLCKRIRMMLNNPKLLYSYYPIVRILKRNNLKFNKSIELGAGTGQLSLILKKLGFVKEVYLVDAEKKASEISKKLFKEFKEECNVITLDLLDLDYSKDYFDLCFSGGLIEHFKGKEQEEVINSHSRIAKHIIFQFPYKSKSYWVMRKLITLKEGKWPFGYEEPLSRIHALRLVNKRNLIVEDDDYHYLPSIITSRIKLLRFIIPYSLKQFPMDYIIYCRKCSK